MKWSFLCLVIVLGWNFILSTTGIDNTFLLVSVCIPHYFPSFSFQLFCKSETILPTPKFIKNKKKRGRQHSINMSKNLNLKKSKWISKCPIQTRKDDQFNQSWEKCKLKPQCITTTHLPTWLKWKGQTIPKLVRMLSQWNSYTLSVGV